MEIASESYTSISHCFWPQPRNLVPEFIITSDQITIWEKEIGKCIFKMLAKILLLVNVQNSKIPLHILK